MTRPAADPAWHPVMGASLDRLPMNPPHQEATTPCPSRRCRSTRPCSTGRMTPLPPLRHRSPGPDGRDRRRPAAERVLHPRPAGAQGTGTDRVANGAAAQQLSLAITERRARRTPSSTPSAGRRDLAQPRLCGRDRHLDRLLPPLGRPAQREPSSSRAARAAERRSIAEIASRRQATRRWGNGSTSTTHPQRRHPADRPEDGDRLRQRPSSWRCSSPGRPSTRSRRRATPLRQTLPRHHPGITIRDRLRVLQPNDPGNYCNARGIVPDDLTGLLGKAQIIITNYPPSSSKGGQRSSKASR